MKTILVVEDEHAIASLVVAILEDEGYRAVVAHHGGEALELVGEAEPDLILSDLMMPFLDGEEMGQRLQADPATRHIPIVFMTARYRLATRIRCDYVALIQKPFDLDALLNVIARTLDDRPT